MPTSALRLFELREVAPGAELSEGTHRVAVALPDSSAHHFQLTGYSGAVNLCRCHACVQGLPTPTADFALSRMPEVCCLCRLVTGCDRGHHVGEQAAHGDQCPQ